MRKVESNISRFIKTKTPKRKGGGWYKHLPKLLLVYKSMPHSSTGFFPFYVMFGRKPKLPIALMLNVSVNGSSVKEVSVGQRG